MVVAPPRGPLPAGFGSLPAAAVDSLSSKKLLMGIPRRLDRELVGVFFVAESCGNLPQHALIEIGEDGKKFLPGKIGSVKHRRGQLAYEHPRLRREQPGAVPL